MLRWKTIAGVGVALALAPLHMATAGPNPLGTSYGSMTARGCYMSYSLSPTVDALLDVSGSISCAGAFAFEEVGVTVLDNGQVVNDGRLAGEPGCGYTQGAHEIGCRFPTERGHAYSVMFDFYMEGEGFSSVLPYPNDAPNAGRCSSSPFTSMEIDYLSCSAVLHYVRT